MSSIKRTDVSTLADISAPVQPQTVAPVAPTQEAAPTTAVAPANHMSSDAPTAGLSSSATPPPQTSSDGLSLVGALRTDANFGLAPNARPGLDLVDPGFEFSLPLMSMDLGAWMQNEIKEHPGSERSQQMKTLLAAMPDALAPIDPALVADI